jgi:glucuronate isomerase
MNVQVVQQGEAAAGQGGLSSDFLLDTPTARWLYHEHAAQLPVIDFHNHVDPQSVADNKSFANLTELWLAGDPYKWRAMRINGVAERDITGDAPARQKFDAWAATLPYAVGNPLMHWSALELQRYFGVDEALSPDTADAIWQHCNQLLARPGWSAQALLEKSNVQVMCTSDDLLDTLEPHHQLQAQPGRVTMLPSLRADSMLAVGGPGFAAFCEALGQLTDLAGNRIDSLEAFQAAVIQRLDRFHSLGCRLADVGLDQPYFEPVTQDAATRLFDQLLVGQTITAHEQLQLKTALLMFAAGEFHARGWALQLHIGAQRQTSQRLNGIAGAAGGYACIGKSSDIAVVCGLLNALEASGQLPRTIIYTLNPSDMDMFASVTGSFTAEGVVCKLQFGPAWWFNDNHDGITRQLKALGNMGLLGRHIGMTTDSRSLLSFSRHEYYRRILCKLIGGWAEAGELPKNRQALASLVENISYFNAKNWLGLTTHSQPS